MIIQYANNRIIENAFIIQHTTVIRTEYYTNAVFNIY